MGYVNFLEGNPPGGRITYIKHGTFESMDFPVVKFPWTCKTVQQQGVDGDPWLIFHPELAGSALHN